MPKTWDRGDAKRFARQLELGRTYWIVMNVARNIAPYEDAQLCSAYVFTKRLPFTGTPCTDGDYSAETLCQNFGPVYDEKPRGIRDIAGAAPQVAGPLPAGYEAILDHAEIRGVEKLASDGSNPRKRRLIGTWRV